MATSNVVATAEILFGRLRSLTLALRAQAADISSFVAVIDGKTPAQRQALFDVLTARGYDQTEITNVYNAIKSVRDTINTQLGTFNFNADI